MENESQHASFIISLKERSLAKKGLDVREKIPYWWRLSFVAIASYLVVFCVPNPKSDPLKSERPIEDWEQLENYWQWLGFSKDSIERLCAKHFNVQAVADTVENWKGEQKLRIQVMNGKRPLATFKLWPADSRGVVAWQVDVFAPFNSSNKQKEAPRLGPYRTLLTKKATIDLEQGYEVPMLSKDRSVSMLLDCEAQQEVLLVQDIPDDCKIFGYRLRWTPKDTPQKQAQKEID